MFFPLRTLAVPISMLEAMLPIGSQLTLLVQDANSMQTLIELNDHILLPPASTQKLVTALAAALYLPQNFTFDTHVYRRSNDIIFQFSGDPTLKRKDLQSLINEMKIQGIRRINGDVWLDGSIFTGYERAVGWPWDILGICYSAPSAAISLERNCVHSAVYSVENKRNTRVLVSNFQPVSIKSDAIMVTKEEKKSLHCTLELYYRNNNSYRLSGCLLHRNQPFPLKFAVQNTKKFVSDILLSEFKKAGVPIKGKIQIGAPYGGRHLISTHSSVKRDELLNTMLKRSDNLIAENLLKTMGHRYYNQSGTFTNGITAIKAILKEKSNIDLSHAVMVDGSGLSRNNRMTAKQLMLVMQYLYTHLELGILAMFPISGIDGTLKYRDSVRHPPLKHNLIAKTGSLYGDYNLAGMLKTEQDRDLLVIQLITNYHIPDTEDLPTNVAPPITQFEQGLYQALFNSTLIPQ
ncbi:serine-type D-Ala-D-Ala carboxypeptidase [Candidatus Enterovibrio escicola]|uniref:serine-type D-Ala-D-Ala carboxypeptidase n=1 Tax=Candidatus Enterovibrio escicola TaxID=1927127 RepID=UPI001CC23100|nr:serine-type D-Ala-D-Ala carboxypeptidase [Candidatus Enterovibrio escacola]